MMLHIRSAIRSYDATIDHGSVTGAARARRTFAPLGDQRVVVVADKRLIDLYPRLKLFAGSAVHTHAAGKGIGAQQDPALIWPANDTLFTSGTLGRYSNTLNSVMENRRKSPGEVTIPVDAIK